MSTETAQTETPAEMDMGALLDSEAAQPSHLRRGEIVEGMVMGASPEGLIVDVGTKTEALIPQGELLSLGAAGASKLKAGDTVKVMVLQPSSSEGHAIVSLDRARGEEGWDTLQARFEAGEVFDAEVSGHNRGGILVNVEGVNAFVPLSQIDSVRRDDPEAVNQLAELVGKPITLKVLELNRKRNRVILSERAAVSEARKEQKDKLIETLQEGDIRVGHISSITDFGVFVDLGGADGLAHMTELTWERGKKARDLYTVGEEVQAYVLKVDKDTKKISLSLKRAQPERWDSTVDRFVVGQILIGRVTKLMAFGAFVRLDGPVEGLIHISELSNRRIQHPKDVVKEGDVVPVKLVRVERDRHRLGLSLRQARHDAEAMGFMFDHDGRVIDYPEDVKTEFGITVVERPAGQGPKGAPKTTTEAIEQAIARDPEPVSAFAHAFQQALENADGPTEFDEATAQTGDVPSSTISDTEVTEASVAETETVEAVADEAVAEVETVEAATDESVGEVGTAQAVTDEPVGEVETAEAVTDEPVGEVETALEESAAEVEPEAAESVADDEPVEATAEVAVAEDTTEVEATEASEPAAEVEEEAAEAPAEATPEETSAEEDADAEASS